MPRALRHPYPGAVYHVMARGDGGKAIFKEDADGKVFLFKSVPVSGATENPYYFRIVADAERLAVGALAALDLPPDRKGLAKFRKGDGNKVLVAALLTERTSLGNGWLAKRLELGHPGAVSRLVGEFRKATRHKRALGKLEKMLNSDT